MATVACVVPMSSGDAEEPLVADVTQLKEHDRAQNPDEPVASRTRRLSGTISHRLVSRGKELRADIEPQNKTPSIKEVAEVLVKEPQDRDESDIRFLREYAHLVLAAENYLKSKQEKKLLKQRLMEVEESLESIQSKTEELAKLIKESRHVVIYTGAGISTSASIPDYRGPNGLWTQIKKTGTFSITKMLDLSSAQPTYTHMSIKELCRRRIVKHVVSQNCDGLHLRSGIAQTNLSEIHGDMYIEVCPKCERQYFREADVTQQTSRFRHKTGRKCHTCPEPNNELVDTIVLYGERSRSKWPMNWERASRAANKADLIICMGSSLKTLRRYSCLWPKHSSSRKSKSDTTKLVIINLQHTSKDKNAILKINGKCDLVMELLMRRLKIQVPAYDWSCDPLLELAVPFTPDERPNLKRNLIFDSKRHMAKLETTTGPHPQQPNEYIHSSASPTSSGVKRSRDDENRESPSLFVSELTDDPDKKRLRMRIRAVNVSATGSSSSPEIDDMKPVELVSAGDDNPQSADLSTVKENNIAIKQEVAEHNNTENSLAQSMDVKPAESQQYEYAPPGWLGKGLGYSKSSSYRRKRRGNKARKCGAGASATAIA